MLTKPFKPLALAFLVNLIISVEDKIKYISIYKKKPHSKCYIRDERYSVTHGHETQAPWGHHRRKNGLEPSL